MSGKICQSADKVLEQFINEVDADTSHHRMVKQEIKCGFGLDGVCCKLCSNGPCRISKTRPKGVCGADADTIAARNFLRSVAAGSGCYIHIVENTAKRLLELARDKREIKGKKALHDLCARLNIEGKDDHELAVKAASAILTDLRKPVEEKMGLISRLAYPSRFLVWEKLGLLPGGAKDEVFNAVVKTSTNLSSDPHDMLMQCLRLGISTGVYGLVLTNLLNDIIIGEPEISFEPVGLKVIEPDYVNIMTTGHQQAMYGDLLEKLGQKEIKKLAASVGAKGIKIVGCTCVGQDFQLRNRGCDNAFCGHAGNNYTSEAVLLTGCIDLVVSEFNCTMPGLEPICAEQGIPMLCLDDVAKKKNSSYLPYSDKQREEITYKIISTALVSFGRRRQNKIRKNPMSHHGSKAITGVTEVSLKKALGGSLKPLIDVIASGKIRGIAAVVGCSNLRAKGHDVFTVELTKKLIANDILVLSAGCTCGGLENCGLMSLSAIDLAGPGLKEVCTGLQIPPVLNFGPCLAIGRIELAAGELAAMLGVDLPQLPVVLSAPQWLEEQALADGAFALALGFPLHLGLAPFVTGSPLVLDILTNQMEQLTGGRLLVETDIDLAAEKLAAMIEEKRKGLGLHE